MQRDRLEGWMVRQIEHADLAKETVIQLPVSRVTASISHEMRSPRSAVGSPRRRFLGHTAVQRPQTTPQSSQHKPLSPADRIRERAASPRSRLDSAAAVVGELDGEDSIARQWRLRFQDPGRSFAEDGGVDRSQVLKGMSPRRVENSGVMEDEWEDELGTGEDIESSPLTLWGMPREYILEYIRQSVMPTSWTTHARFTGEWEAVPPSEADGRYAPKTSTEDGSELSTLPMLSSRVKSPTSPLRSPRATGISSAPLGGSSPSRTYRRPHPGATVVPPTSPRLKPPRCEERIHQILNELRADPKAWVAFQKDVKKYISDKQNKQHESSRDRERRSNFILSPRAPDVLAERKRQNDERLRRVQRHRTLLIEQEDERLEAKLMAYRRRTQPTGKGGDGDDKPFDVTTTVGYRRRKMWLLAITFGLASTQLQQRLVREKQRQILEKMQSKAARIIQRLWKKWKWRHASKQTIVIYTWLRKCMWKLMFKMRCRRKHRHATVLQRFMLDQLSGSRETRNFNRMMLKWRGKVILCQRLSVSFINCTRARLSTLSMWWDTIDHERQRSERQLHERLLPTTDDKEAEWNAIVNNRGRLLRRPSTMNGSSRSLNITAGAAGSTPASSTPSTSTPTSTPAPPLAASGSSASLSRRSTSTRQLLDQMDERLTTMQQVLTPFEIQRLQQHAFHVVKIPKAIKMRLLQELLTNSRKEYIRQLTTYQDQVACASYAREVRLDDARAIVQSGASWGSLLTDERAGQRKLRRPIFQLYGGDKPKRMMEELVKRGVQLTLESDAEQRSIVERQRQQRQSLEAGAISSGVASAMSSSRKRESSSNTGLLSPAMQLPPTGGSIREEVKKATRKLTFAIPTTISEKGTS